MNNEVKVIRYDESNLNVEALKGKYGQVGNKDYSITIIKNLMFVNLYSGCKIDINIPEVYDGFLITSNNRRIKITNNNIKASLSDNETAFGQFVLKKWN